MKKALCCALALLVAAGLLAGCNSYEEGHGPLPQDAFASNAGDRNVSSVAESSSIPEEPIDVDEDAVVVLKDMTAEEAILYIWEHYPDKKMMLIQPTDDLFGGKVFLIMEAIDEVNNETDVMIRYMISKTALDMYSNVVGYEFEPLPSSRATNEKLNYVQIEYDAGSYTPPDSSDVSGSSKGESSSSSKK